MIPDQERVEAEGLNPAGLLLPGVKRSRRVGHHAEAKRALVCHGTSTVSLSQGHLTLAIIFVVSHAARTEAAAHLRIIGPMLPSGGDPGAAFTAITQIGTEAAVLLYFRKDIWRIATAWLQSLRQPFGQQTPDSRMGWLIIVGTLPIAILGLLFKDAIETSLRNLYITATMLIVFALLLAWADRIVCSPDSVNMITEACATRAPVFVFDSALRFGHFVWHLFVMAGSGCHLAAALAPAWAG